MIRGAVATKEFRPITRPRGLTPAEVGKSYAVSELAVPDVACEHDPRFRVDLGDDEGRGGAPRNAEHPLDIRRHRETSCSAGMILDREARNFERVLTWHELQKAKR